MSIQSQLIIFARAPEYGRVKQRLAQEIGKRKALAFYIHTLSRLLAELNHGPWRLTVATDTRQASRHPVFQGLATVPQPAGDLGYRMSSVLEQFAGQPRVLIGSDIPAVRPVHIASAFNTLNHHDIVFGPACDGGFWLVGCDGEFTADPAAGSAFMKEVRWSTEHALADTLNTLPQGCLPAMVSTLEDIDNAAAYHRYMTASGRPVNEH